MTTPDRELLVALERPMYTPAEVARWANTTPQTARRWVSGYRFATRSGELVWSPPVTQREGLDYLTFQDLVEVAVVAAARRAGVSMPKIRRAVEYARSVLQVPRPLLSLRFKTDGHNLFLRDRATDPHFTVASEFGQLAWEHIASVLRDIDYYRVIPAAEPVAAAWWPRGRQAGIVLDPLVNFGRPIVAELGVRTETLIDRFQAGMGIAEIAESYGTRPDVVEEVLRFEGRFPAAA